MKDLFEEKDISPMLIARNVEPFADPDYIYELKWDGERCIAYLDPGQGTDLRNKRNVRMLPKVPELSGIHQQARVRCVLDGELLCLVNGKPEFEAIQRRSLLGNRYRIEFEAGKKPATFIAFDCLYYDGKDISLYPLVKRKEYLDKAISETGRLAISRTFEDTQAFALFGQAKKQGLEGIVAKKKDSVYFQGKRTHSWLKIKNLMDEDFVVCGYRYSENHMAAIILGQYRDGKLVPKGHVPLGVSGLDFARIKAQPRFLFAPFEKIYLSNDEEPTVWIAPELVCIVQFMYWTKSGSMRQPVFKGLRDDKDPLECKEEVSF